MNKTAIKNFSIWARRKLIADAAYRAGLMGITPEGIAAALPQSTRTTEFYDIGTREPYALTGDAISQRRRLVDTIRRKERDTNYATAYKYILEEVAYTWFNRLIAIRFMEVNDYLPSHVRVLSSESGKLEPDLVTKPFDTDLVFSSEETEEIRRLHEAGDVDALFQLLFIKQCNALHEILPRLFERTSDVTELLFRVSVVDPEGVVYKLVHDISEDDFNIEKDGQAEIIGWLYQYYNTEPKNEAFAKNGKISKEEIPAVTQLFTPDWIVRYMVENSLGRVVINNLKYDNWAEEEKAKIDVLRAKWKYYIDEAEQTPEVETELRAMEHNKYASGEQLPFVDTTFLDPCMGSGHILVYAFDVFMDIYRVMGWSDRDAAQRIIQKNLYGLDIDERAAQLAYFSLMMKARQYDRRFFTRNLQPNVYSAKGYPEGEEFGSLITVDELEPAPDFDHWTLHDGDYQQALNRWSFRYVLAQKYDVVVTNPPYMGSGNMGAVLSDFVKKYYPDSKADLYACFIERGIAFSRSYIGMITQHSWMFLPSFEMLRRKLNVTTILNMAHLGARAFEEISGEVVQTTSFVLFNCPIHNYQGTYYRLLSQASENGKERSFINHEGRFFAKQSSFSIIPGAPIAYWVSDTILSAFAGKKLGDIAYPKQGLSTADNERFLRLWFEVKNTNFSADCNSPENALRTRVKWFPFNKGGGLRKWYGNFDYVINWLDGGRDIKRFRNAAIRNPDYYFMRHVTWSKVSTGTIAFRLRPEGSLFSDAGCAAIFDDKNIWYALGLLNTKFAQHIFNVINPTINYTQSTIANLPYVFCAEKEKTITDIVCNNLSISMEDWDSFETSWDFKTHPLIAMIPKGGAFFEVGNTDLFECFELWKAECEERFHRLKANEEELNRIFIDIYGLQDELTPEVEDKDVTVRRADLGRDIRSLISYAVGCMFGRYSPGWNGLAYAGGEWDDSRYTYFRPDEDNVIPITDEAYLEDDIVTRFVEFIRTVYGSDSLEDNLDFISKALGNKGGSSREVIRNYFLNDFFNDHCQTYSVTGSGKRPIYWLFDSGKQNGFKALIYLHRYTPDTVGTLRVDYLHRLQRVYESEIDRMQDMIDSSANSREIAAATKRKEKLIKQLKECRDYDEKLAHLALARIELDLDDGVKVNYRKLQTTPDGKFYEVLAQSKNIMAKEK